MRPTLSEPLTDIEPAALPVLGEELYRDLIATIQRFIYLSDAAAAAVTLWVINAHLFAALGPDKYPFNYLPILAVTSPTRRCGKSRLLELLGRLCPRPLRSSNASPAALYHAIETEHPTVLLDEFDSVNPQARDDLKNILNGSFERGQAVLRMQGEGAAMEVKRFDLFGPVAVAAIAHLPPTVIDRSIFINLDRKPPGVEVDRMRGEALAELTHLASQSARWAADNATEVRPGVELPNQLCDRTQDVWECVLTIAYALGPEPEREARRAAVVLAATSPRQDDDLGEELLRDLAALADQWGEHVTPSAIVAALNALSDRPWSDLGRAGITTSRLGRMLRRFGVTTGVRWLGDGRTERSYDMRALQNLFGLYLVKKCNAPLPDAGNAQKQGLLRITEKTRDRGVESGEKTVMAPAAPGRAEL
jgi:putative DNA primase/helicase